MRFISPKIDYAFKKIFGSQQSQAILISFLNAIVYDGENIIQSLTIVNPYNPDKTLSLKETDLDIKAILADGTLVAIEIQTSSMTAFNKRVAYNLAKTYANQLITAKHHIRFNPAITVTITDFILYQQSEKVINKFVFQEKEENFEVLDQELQLIFVELPKFKKTLSELTSLSDKWIYFLKEANSLDSIPKSLEEVSEIELALNLANQANMTVDELEVVDTRSMMLQDEKGRITYAEERGQLTEAIALIKRQLKKRFGEIPKETSSKVEDLSLVDLESLTEEIFDFTSLSDLVTWLAER
ncbi:MAG: Rpn family recombination-promoting nuclease/putative transposase [Symploca sp. SIO1C2]|nr:Rpn family recombination-promoting nuclease/putative transposase [Symploca sp. SIO1C2]